MLKAAYSIYLSIDLSVYSDCLCSTVVWFYGIKQKALLQMLQKLSGERLGKNEEEKSDHFQTKAQKHHI